MLCFFHVNKNKFCRKKTKKSQKRRSNKNDVIEMNGNSFCVIITIPQLTELLFCVQSYFNKSPAFSSLSLTYVYHQHFSLTYLLLYVFYVENMQLDTISWKLQWNHFFPEKHNETILSTFGKLNSPLMLNHIYFH